VREFHEQLFRYSVGAFRKELERITGRTVREGAADIDPGTGCIVHVFTTGTAVHVFLLDERASAGTVVENDAGAPA
jgi:hypothetical protein